MSDLVSIVIPVRDREGFLPEAIESALGQDHDAVEVIVVDDGSSDRSAEIADGYGVRVLRRPPCGVSAARNAGVAASTGRYVTFLDSDDLMLPRRVSVQVSFLEAHPETGCVLCRQELLFEEGAEIPDWAVADARFGDPGGVHPLSAMVPADVARRFPFDESMSIAEDMDWLFRLRADGIGIRIIPEFLMRRRVHGANTITGREDESREWILRSIHRRMAERRRPDVSR